MFQDHKKAWDECLSIIKKEIGQQSFKIWFEPIEPYQYKNNTLTLQVPSKFVYEWLEENYLNVLHKAIKKVLGADGKLSYIIKKEADLPVQTPTKHPVKKIHNLQHKHFITPLNPSYTFENFITGSNNQLIKSVAQAIAKNPGKTAFNPAIVHAKSGMGKTMLAQAIINEVNRIFGNQLVALYIPAQKFISTFIESVKSNTLPEFSKFFEGIDLLVIDDIQDFREKSKSQEIFFTIFNHLHQSNKQIIMTSDCRPADLQGLEQRLLSRFKWGLTTELQLPDLETRIAIIQNKLAKNNTRIDQNLIEYIAVSIETNIRDIEGVVTSLVAHASFNSKAIDYNLVKSTLENIVCKVESELTPDYLQKTIATHYKLSVEQLQSKSRKREVVVARQVAMCLIKEYTSLSLKSIGRYFGGKDHSTVIYAQKSINNLLGTDRYFKKDFDELQQHIKRRNPTP